MGLSGCRVQLGGCRSTCQGMAGQTGVFKLLQTTLYFDLHRSNACCLLHNISSEDPEQTAVFNSPVLQQ